MTESEIITAIKDVIMSVAAVVTAVMAVLGLKSWQRELKGKTEFEVARSLLRDTYKVRDQLSYARNPMTLSNEFPQGYNPLQNQYDPKTEADAHGYAFTNRWKPVVEAVLEYELTLLEAEAIWGSEIKSLCFELRKCCQRLNRSMNTVVSDIASEHDKYKGYEHIPNKARDDVWSSNDDELTANINAAVEAIEQYLRPHIKRN
ncbi:hypothetical protein [Vibrio parahaemolyticus]|uniref:hypothetical protein n=1 Tax=Vibrio parahaemolyticus TaxID=670 RepID=UPI001EEA782E|nr:hypothetical protein [Vibrio parahaemolyticus]MCG6479689.1 hypothetical protein [Vibrio parahaemolyticus]HCG6765717.1 hypothetical protein [Vibrio parahaemolyticus]